MPIDHLACGDDAAHEPMPMSRRGIARRRDGSFRVRLPREERDVLAQLPGQLREALAADEPSVYRLFPPAFSDDAQANVAYHRLVGESLLDGKLAALRELERTAYDDELDEPVLESWLGAVESLRLVLGTQLDVREETAGIFDPDAPDAPRLALYHWLSWLQEEIVQALSTGLASGGFR
jgi:hypothetical protein